MTIYFLFGKTGTGKSYVGDMLSQKTGLPHIDGDRYITPAMREALETETPMTPEMIDDFVRVLVTKIRARREEEPHQSLIVSQAMYMNKHRAVLQAAFGDEIILIHVKSDDVVRKQRIKKRNEAKQSLVTLELAAEMDPKFEQPTHSHQTLHNENDDEALYDEFLRLRENTQAKSEGGAPELKLSP